MVDAISKELEADRKRVERIVRTETAAIQNKASIDAYKGLGVDKIQVLGTLDRVTCEKCGSFDGKIFEIDKVQQDLNIPPFHPNCRCTTVPYDEDWGYKGQRIAKDDNGNDYYVPEDMSYEEWKRKYVDGKEDNETIKGTIVNSVGAKSAYYPNLKWDGDGEDIEYVQGSRPFYPKNHLMAGYGTNKKNQGYRAFKQRIRCPRK